MDGVDLGSRFAGSLGFSNEMAWPDSAVEKKREKRMRSSSRSRSSSAASNASSGSTGDDSAKDEDGKFNANSADAKALQDEFSQLFVAYQEDDSRAVPSSGTALGNVLQCTHLMSPETLNALAGGGNVRA